MILALDLGSCVGWALARPGAAPLHGSHRLPAPQALGNGCGTGFGRTAAAYCDWLADMLTVHRPDIVYFEAPLPRGDFQGINAGRVLLGLAWDTELICWRRELPCIEVAVSSVRSEFLRARPRQDAKGAEIPAKERVNLRCVELGYAPQDHNAADAIALLHFAMARRKERAA